jgi:nicotinate-nucleotide adenylyltransferase
MTQYAMYGGSFDPIHMGHLSVVERAVGLGYHILVVPAYRHAFGKQSEAFEHRVRMCELALQDRHLHTQAHVCTIEQTLARSEDAPIYTYDVLCALRAHLKQPPCLLVGPDIAREWTRWYQHDAIDREFKRLSMSMTLAIRSSTLRQQLHDGVDLNTLKSYLTPSVRAYIAAHGIYTSTHLA